MSLLSDLPKLLRHDESMAPAISAPEAFLAIPENVRAFFFSGLVELTEARPLVIVTPTVVDAERLHVDMSTWLGEARVELFPAWETLPFERVSPSIETMGKRVRAMWHLHADSADKPDVIIAPVKAVLQRLGPHVEELAPVTIRRGDTIDPTDLVERLVKLGYRRDYQVEARGDVAIRGSIVDVFPSTGDMPVRIDLWGDDVDRMTTFTLTDQRSVDQVDNVELFACRELLPTDEVREHATALMAQQPWGAEQWERIAQGMYFDGIESWLPWLTKEEHVLMDLLGENAQVIFVEPKRMHDRANELLDEEESLAQSLAQTWGAHEDKSVFPKLHVPVDRLVQHVKAPLRMTGSVPTSPDAISINASAWTAGSEAGVIAKQLSTFLGEDNTVVIVAESDASANRMVSALRDEGASAAIVDKSLRGDAINVIVAQLERGFRLPSANLAVFPEAELTGRRRSHRVARPRKRVGEGFFDDLSPGAYVVHYHHGVGRFQGMVKRSIGGAERDYLLLEYRGNDRLYVPSDQIDAIRPYVGGETPSLHRLGGSDFGKTKARVRSAVDLVAAELVVLYQKRTHAEGHAFAPDTPWQQEMESAFPYSETRDQLTAIADVKSDMERAIPMDRLICGDVGFGKTEVAIRAAFKAVQDGKQVAILVPTTLLAQQHFATFRDRYAPYPLRVEVLSRFLTAKQARDVMQGIARGDVDIVIGTHLLLSQSVKFARLGLLILDEEQRFGVTHKESIKQLQANVDVLTLSATPIPRTLEMSLTGIRDLTILNTPPADRQPILTYVGEWDERAVSEAIRRELLREGQVFFVHNRVQDIARVAQRLRELVPEARVGVAHGQMDEGSLEQVVIDFWENEYDVLVCTTIIESGIDMPTVNTLVVDRADRLGLGQLHQLRGRVGRSGQRAYAYLFYPPDVSLTEQAYERLKTIGENTALGSGFKIAMRDLEIRGAGNLLGGEQSGHIAAVGYDLYVQMVTEAVAQLKGEPIKQPAEIKLELPVNANLPPAYVERDDVRLEAYRRLAAVQSTAEVEDIRAEWLDRFGPIPPEAETLLEIALLRAECARVGVREVAVTKDTARIAPVVLKVSDGMRLNRLYPKAIWKEDSQTVVLPVPVVTKSPLGSVTFKMSTAATKRDNAKKPSIARFLQTFLHELLPPENGD